MSSAKGRVTFGDGEQLLDDADERCLAIIEAGRKLKLDGSVEQLRGAARVCMALARDAAQAALLLENAADTKRRDAELAALMEAKKP